MEDTCSDREMTSRYGLAETFNICAAVTISAERTQAIEQCERRDRRADDDAHALLGRLKQNRSESIAYKQNADPREKWVDDSEHQTMDVHECLLMKEFPEDSGAAESIVMHMFSVARCFAERACSVSVPGSR